MLIPKKQNQKNGRALLIQMQNGLMIGGSPIKTSIKTKNNFILIVAQKTLENLII